MKPSLFLIAEDHPGLAIGRKLIEENDTFAICREINGHGYGQLKTNATKYNDLSATHPVLMLTDLDASLCPSEKIRNWLGRHGKKPGFLFRICVREIEAWLLAHTDAMAQLLSISENLLPQLPETLDDPKAELIKLAQKSPRKIREGMTPRGSATIGPEYNQILTDFIEQGWTPAAAAKKAPSLARARHRIADYAKKLTSA